MNLAHESETVARTRAVLEIDVANHAGVMSHVVGFFSRRLFNVEGILCLPIGDGRNSRIWLLVHEDLRLPQMIRQLQKLEDVIAVRRYCADRAPFGRLQDFALASCASVPGPPVFPCA